VTEDSTPEDSPSKERGDAEGTDADDHALAPEDLQYPEFVFEEGDVSERGGFDLETPLDRDEMGAWLEDLAGGLTSHDVAVESSEGHVRFGVGPKAVEMSFDPDEECRGELEITFRLNAKAMFIADDPTKPKVGARGGTGFIPVEMLTEDRDVFRCYSWIDDPTDL
jgi:hypothetical protein